MAVKVWDAQSNAFKDAEIPMMWDSQAGAYKDSTGLVYDESTGAWSERWGECVKAYVYGAVQEIITIKRAGIAVKQITTDSSGRSTEPISLPCGIYDLTGSVSGWTETQIVDKNTERFISMPKNSIYWYGNECKDMTGGLRSTGRNGGTIQKNTNNIKIYGSSSKDQGLTTINIINFGAYRNYSIIFNKINTSVTYGGYGYLSCIDNPSSELVIKEKIIGNTGNYSWDISGINGMYYPGFHTQLNATIEICALWLE